ncbi:MAG: glycosyltransferase [Candidatus Liptonbacteria bacterium]|nr:glycosyltransferase [Candidatus Liptonbacteria bacterium]
MGIKILYTGLERENYDPNRGLSFEYTNFYSTLKNMPGILVTEFPFDPIVKKGRKKWNSELIQLLKERKPDVLFAFMYTNELDFDTLRFIRKETNTKSVAWFADDYWRFWNYSKYWPPYFDLAVTTYSKALAWYGKRGCKNVILSQWACNTNLYKPVDVPKDFEVSFVGQWKPQRAGVINALKDAGVKVQTFGYGWPGGKVSHEEMLRIFSRSKINLNLTGRASLFSPRVLARILFKRSAQRIVPDFHFINNLRAYLHFSIPHTHARPFELAGCRAFVISGFSEDIPRYYEEGKEMAFYRSPRDLVEKVKHYLAHDGERERIANAAYKRTLREHTYEKRFEDIFKNVGVV